MPENLPSPPVRVKKVPTGTSIVHLLEHGDGMAHILVAILLLVLALGVLVNSTYAFVHDLSKTAGTSGFAESALTYLSDVLLGVIILELLSTILTYIQARNLEATVKDFLVVGLISSVRKILLIGAQSSIAKATGGDEFVKEAIGTVISIVGILLLIGGLLLLDYRKKRAVPLADTDGAGDIAIAPESTIEAE